jgi:PilZ domain
MIEAQSRRARGRAHSEGIPVPPPRPKVPMSEPITERRRHARLNLAAPLHLRPAVLHAAEATELTEGGMAFSISQPLAPGTPLELLLFDRNVRVHGIVRHRETLADGRYRIGVVFDAPQPELAAAGRAAWDGARG